MKHDECIEYYFTRLVKINLVWFGFIAYQALWVSFKLSLSKISGIF